jgi:hypothetical protein
MHPFVADPTHAAVGPLPRSYKMADNLGDDGWCVLGLSHGTGAGEKNGR